MATSQDTNSEQIVPENNDQDDVLSVQARYLRSPSPSRFSVMSDTDTESIFMEPIHLSSAVAASQIINEELKHKEIKVESMSPKMMESAEQLLVEDLYNRVKGMIDDTSRFNTPCIMDIQRELMQKLEAPRNAVDEVWPNIFICDTSVAVNKGRLKRLGISHVLNAAHNTGVYTRPEFYAGMEIQYLGIEADDFPDVDLSKYFRKGAEFLDEALLTCKGKVLVSSVMGVSRSAALVTAYLMIFHDMTIMEALMTLRKKRPIYPNEGFLKQLRELNENLLDERGRSDSDDETQSQCSVIEAKAHTISVAEEETQSIIGAKVHSIMVEEEDTASMITGSVMSSVAKSSIASKRPTLIDVDEEERIYEEWRVKQGLPPKEQSNTLEEKRPELPEDFEEEDDVDWLVREWQRKNEKFQSCWQPDHLSDDEENRGSTFGKATDGASERDDTESVDSLYIELLKQNLDKSLNKPRRVRNDSESTDTSTWDMWDERLLEISKRASKGNDDSNLSFHGNGGRKRDPDEESSVFSDTSSFFNFCKKNKDKLTPLQRWQIKRIQFGWNKKDSKATDGNQLEESEEREEAGKKSLDDVNLTAYQSWKLKHQKKLGNENKDEIIDLTKDEDTASKRTKQRRAEVLERSKQTLAESQSMCGFETESSMSGSIPMSLFLPNLSARSVSDDTASVLSMQSNASSVSRARTVSGLGLATGIAAPSLQVNNDDTISIASIQKWIASVVSEQIAIKQNEIMGGQSAPGPTEDDKLSHFSMQSGNSYAGSLLGSKAIQSTDVKSTMSCRSLSSLQSEGLRSKEKITNTSKPLYSLFADEVNLKELDHKQKQIKSEMKDKMDAYKKEKLVSDNKRSTLFKKKNKGENEDDGLGGTPSGRSSYSRAEKYDIASDFTGASTGAGASNTTINIHKWLSDVKEVSVENKTLKEVRDVDREKKLNEVSFFKKYDSPSCSTLSKDSASSHLSRDVDLRTSSFANVPLTDSDYISRRFPLSYRAKDDDTTNKLRRSTPSPHSESYTFQRPEVEEARPSGESFSGASLMRSSPIEMQPSGKDLGFQSSDQPMISPCPRRSRFWNSETDMNDSDHDDSLEMRAKRTFKQSFTAVEEEGNGKGSESDHENPAAKKGLKSTVKSSSVEEDDEIIAAWRSRQEEMRMKLHKRHQKE
ncbi:LOW QUALITY PROTEIN: serine/threonine/tyrosine-interacting-like protein 2 [Callorhinchus milii]|uniref:LOW QUALITY PROTEIN: serine/threonine/tyrosine-interacting-like protein 2 n=1 Tax=Callorhinchus milii TaxID=7868 RepID=UPI001C3F9010|nr:LOW QUALITY PROTEIN: serine/threonine/tyrosine-interacting-like protein 2 [Callorhinchus milii]